MYQITCVICQKIFPARIPHKKTCSAECRKKLAAQNGYNAYLRNLENGVTKICEICQGEYKVEVDRAEESRFCSIKCAAVGKRYTNKKERKTVICAQCGKEFMDKIDGVRKFCSRECNSLFQNGKDRAPPVHKFCPQCGKEYVVRHRNRNRKMFCSRSCSTTYQMRNMDHVVKGKWCEKISATVKGQFGDGERIHPWLGKSHSEKTKQRISDAKSERGGNLPENNPMYGRHHSIESREAMSKTRSEKIISGEYATWFDKGKHFSTKMNAEISYRSSWEKTVMEQLDRDESVESYSYEPFTIPYLFEGLEKNYIPDILIIYKNGREVLVEIKPKTFSRYAINLAKFAAAHEFCEQRDISFEVWTEENLNL